jgi:type II secretory pathway component GspD/PulD (secretin)
MRSRLCWIVILLVLLCAPGVSTSQDTASWRDDVDLQRLVEFTFTASDISEVIHHLAQLTGWSVFYDPDQVRGKVSIVTPGKIPLEQAIRLVQGATRSYGQAIQVLTPNQPQPVPLAAVLASLSSFPEPPEVIVWRNSNARDPQSPPCTCEQQYGAYPMPYWFNVIVDERHP